MLVRLYKYLRDHNELFLTPELTFLATRFLDFGNIIIKQYGSEEIFVLYKDYFLSNILYSIVSVISFFMLLLYFVSYISYKRELKSKNYSSQFFKLMNSYTDSIFKNTKGNGNISWGKEKVVMISPRLIEGWKPKDIKIDLYDDIEFDMRNLPEFYNQYKEFCNGEKFKEIETRGNNLARVMIERFHINYDKNNPKLFLNMKRTRWAQCSFIWDELSKNKELLEDATCRLMYSKGKLYPNSFSLHLVVVSSDNKVVLSRICKHKYNDYPDSIAATLGEQLEIYDFVKENSFEDDFVSCWVKRACREEFGITESQLEEIFNLNSIRVLSMNYEGDIYNLSLLTTIRLNIGYEEFEKQIQCTFQTKEANMFYGLEINQIPNFIFKNKYKDLYEKHPSTDLRVLLVYFHMYGIKRGCKNIIQAYKQIRMF